MNIEPNAKRRTAILLLAHAPLASAYARVTADMGYPASDLLTLDMPTEMTRSMAFDAAMVMLREARIEECLVLVDLGGGASPFKVAQQLQASLGSQLRVLAGLNTSMLMTAICHRNLDVDELARRAAQRAADGVERYPAL